MTKSFAVRTLLTVTTGRLLTASKGPRDNGIDDLYDLLGWMAGESPYTHQLGRFCDECKPWLLRWFPGLVTVDLARLDALIAAHGGELGVETWLNNLPPAVRAEYAVPKIPADDHDRKDPVAELVEMRRSAEGIIIVTPEG